LVKRAKLQVLTHKECSGRDNGAPLDRGDIRYFRDSVVSVLASLTGCRAGHETPFPQPCRISTPPFDVYLEAPRNQIESGQRPTQPGPTNTE